MIARLEGVLRERAPTRVVIDVVGVGYEAHIPLSTFGKLPAEGEKVALRIHTHVREEALLLYGFATELECASFELLLHASRVGPKLAQTILSGIDAPALLGAIRDGDVDTLKRVPGVGARTAERIIVELRERAGELLAQGAGGAAQATSAASAGSGVRAELLSALLNLQTPRGRAERVADAVLAEEDAEGQAIEDLLRQALRRLAR